MKHLKPFNEDIINRKDELKDLCEDCLAYLLDEGYSFHIYDVYTTPAEIPAYIVWFNRFYNNRYNEYKWDDIKEYYIPFLKLLNKYYNVIGFNEVPETLMNKSIRINLPDNKSQDFEFEDFIGDTFDQNININSIGVLIKK